MLYAPGNDSRARRTVCVSTQVGCALDCAFCATGKGSFGRNLTAGEIVEQVLYFARQFQGHDPEMESEAPGADASPITNVILAGMGEPLANYAATWAAVERLNDPAGFGLGARHMTISTAGLVPGIRRLAGEKLQVNLAVSLHAPDDVLRAQLMPIARRYPLAELLAACREYSEKTGRRVSFEYILIDGVNSSSAQARQLAALLEGMLCHVNLIPMNPIAERPWRPPSHEAVLAFERELARRGITTTVRLERGVEIQAACGQLRARQAVETKKPAYSVRGWRGEVAVMASTAKQS
jgi:23S rRNA (adenine2503-C2)-methyltransferase